MGLEVTWKREAFTRLYLVSFMTKCRLNSELPFCVVLNAKGSRQGSQSCILKQQGFWLDLVSQCTLHQKQILDKVEALFQQKSALIEWHMGCLAGREAVWMS